MTRDDLKNWALSEYNEDTEDQLDYYINENECSVGDKAYLYNHAEDKLSEMEITHIIARSDDEDFYDGLPEDILIVGDNDCDYDSDVSAEFITDNDCYLVWFKYTDNTKTVFTKEEVIEMLREMQTKTAKCRGFFAGHVTQMWVIRDMLGKKIEELGGESIKIVVK